TPTPKQYLTPSDLAPQHNHSQRKLQMTQPTPETPTSTTSTFTSPANVANLVLSLLQTKSYLSLLDISSEYLKDRFTILHREGQDVLDAFRVFAWIEEKQEDVRVLEDMVGEWDGTEGVGQEVGEVDEQNDGVVQLGQPLYRVLDEETIHAYIPFAMHPSLDKSGVVVLDCLKGNTPEDQTTTPPKEVYLFLFHTLELLPASSTSTDHKPSISLALEAHRLEGEKKRQGLLTSQDKAERDYWDQYDRVGGDEEEEEENKAGNEEGDEKKDGKEEGDSENDYWGAYDEVMDRDPALYSL
ncbi:hypothetical protein HK097_000967, partial [Rhizophlyctis rosea]